MSEGTVLFWLLAAAIPVLTALVLFRPLLRRGGSLLGLGLALLLLLPVTTLLLYQGVGTPAGIRVAEVPPAVAEDADINELLMQLEARMAAEPDDVEGWMLLGRSYRSLQRYDEARAAFEQARRLEPNDPAVAVELAEAMIFTSPPGEPDPAVDGLLAQALDQAPDMQKALWLSGMMAAQDGDDTRAVSLWTRLMALLEPGSGVATSVQQQLDAARGRLGLPASGQDAVEAAWGGIEIVVAAPDQLPALSPAAALFIIARDPASPNPPLGAIRLPPAFPAVVTLTDANSMMPQRPISGVGELQLQARLALDGNPLSTEPGPESDSITVERDRGEPVELRLN
ncbi:MAG: tetratricopeptide repeat protein [Xanthomonadales bacterium]|jgi:cytochrome c-type biogenesis protein CcmH|nr:tetratricopeptide repeat protein [Xanthomonadales bacterium]